MNTNETFLRRAKKLLALAHDGAATEAEAALAAEKLQELLQDHNLTLSQVEASSSDTPAAARTKHTTEAAGMYAWQRALMGALADNNFCLHHVKKVFIPHKTYGSVYKLIDGEHTRGYVGKRHLLIGRSLNVEVTTETYGYIVGALKRLNPHHPLSREGNHFLEGAVSRLTERLYERRKEAETASAAPKGNGTGKELILTDVYGSESDLNNDALNNFPAGTTAANRRKAEERMNARYAERDRLVAEGVDPDVAWYRAHGYGEEEAKAAIKRDNRRRGGRGRTQNWTRGDEAHYRKINSPAYKAGRVAGAEVGLDDQVGATRRKALT